MRKSRARIALGIFVVSFALSFLVAVALCLGIDEVVGKGVGCSLLYMVGWAARWAGIAVLLGTFLVPLRAVEPR